MIINDISNIYFLFYLFILSSKITHFSASLSIIGGLMVYGTIIGYRYFFSRGNDYDYI